jgi:chorismate synthase
MSITEEEIYADLLLRKPGADELSSPRKEPDLPVIFSGTNAADTVENAGNKNLTNGTPLTILIPNLDRHFIHIKQYQDTNRTPRPGHASYASFIKYGPADDAIGAGIFSGRYTSTIVGAGAVAKKILAALGIDVFAYVREAAGIDCGEVDSAKAKSYASSYKKMRCEYDPFYREIYVKGRITPDMRFLEKMRVFAEIEKEIDVIREKAPAANEKEILEKYGVNHILNCPNLEAASEMITAINQIAEMGDSSGGLVEVIVDNMPVGVGEPVFGKLDGELGRLLGIGAVKSVEIGAGIKVKDMTGSKCNDQMHSEDGRVVFDSNNAGGVTGGLSNGQPVIIRLAVKPTPTINKKQHTIDKYTLKNTELGAITRRDPTIVARIWPVAENFTALLILDELIAHFGYQRLMQIQW